MGRPIVSLFTEIQDAKGAISITKMNFPTSTDIAILKTFARSTATMIDALVASGWMDRDLAGRLVIHDWPDHADDAVHMRLARARQLFIGGRAPEVW